MNTTPATPHDTNCEDTDTIPYIFRVATITSLACFTSTTCRYTVYTGVYMCVQGHHTHLCTSASSPLGQALGKKESATNGWGKEKMMNEIQFSPHNSLSMHILLPLREPRDKAIVYTSYLTLLYTLPIRTCS